MIQIQGFTFNAFAENMYVLYDDSKECVIIDPGCYDSYERMMLQNFITKNQLKPVQLLNTHCHLDHVFGNAFVKETYKLPLKAHQLEIPVLKRAKEVSPMYGLTDFQDSTIDEYIDEGDKITFGDSELEILFVPGHAPGHIAFINKAQKFCIGGDVLFRESIGRSDLPGGDHETLLNSIRTKMFTLGDDFVVYPGHGEPTEIGFEKKHNPFLKP